MVLRVTVLKIGDPYHYLVLGRSDSEMYLLNESMNH